MPVTLPIPTFTWGSNGAKVTPEALDQQQKVVDALMANTDKLPTNFWEGANGAVDALVGNTLQARHDDALAKAQTDFGSQFSALGDNPSRTELESLAGNSFANPQQEAVVKALLAQNLEQTDPSSVLDRQYKQAQIDALNAKPAQPLINAGSGTIYDPNSKSWITAPAGTGAADQPVVPFEDDGRPDPAAQDAFLKSIPDPKYAAIVKGVANYELDPAKVTSMRGDQRQKLVEDAKAYDPTYDGTQFGVRVAARKDFTSGQSALNLKSANTLIGHLYDLSKASTALGNSGFTPWNMAVNAVKGNTDNPDIVRYKIAGQAAADELAKVFKGGGASDVESIRGWQNSLDPNAGPTQQQAAISQAITLLSSRVAALRDQYQNAMGKPADFQVLNNASVPALIAMHINPSDIDPNYKPPADGDGSPSAPKVLSKDTKQADQEFDELPSGAHFVGPDGVPRVKP